MNVNNSVFKFAVKIVQLKLQRSDTFLIFDINCKTKQMFPLEPSSSIKK